MTKEEKKAIKYLKNEIERVNKDYIKYSCIISNFTDKIKLLEELLEEE